MNYGMTQPSTLMTLFKNKLAKARKTRKWPGTLGLKQFGPGKLRIKNVWSQNIFIDFFDQA